MGTLPTVSHYVLKIEGKRMKVEVIKDDIIYDTHWNIQW